MQYRYPSRVPAEVVANSDPMRARAFGGWCRATRCTAGVLTPGCRVTSRLPRNSGPDSAHYPVRLTRWSPKPKEPSHPAHQEWTLLARRVSARRVSFL